MAANAFEAGISDRFRLPAPTLMSPFGKAAPMTFSRIQCDHSGHGLTQSLPFEDAYVLHVMMRDLGPAQLWINGQDIALPNQVPKGGVFLFHFETDPVASMDSPFDIVRFSVSKSGLDELARDAGLPPLYGLRRPDFGVADPILYHMASSLLPLFSWGQAGSQMVLDHIALAFHAHLRNNYNGAPLDVRVAQGGLAPWQIRRAKEFIEANICGDPSLEELALQCEISVSHFARAFRASIGRPPHQYLIERRIEASKIMLRDGQIALKDIAARCGFSDQSHFSRVFSRHTGQTPAVWRRLADGHGAAID